MSKVYYTNNWCLHEDSNITLGSPFWFSLHYIGWTHYIRPSFVIIFTVVSGNLCGDIRSLDSPVKYGHRGQ